MAVLSLTVLFAQPSRGEGAELKVWSARAIATVLASVGSEFERATGHKLTIVTDLAPTFVRRSRAGEPFDVMITGSVSLAGLVEEGRIIADTRAPIARSGIGVGIRAGAMKPDIRTVDTFKAALLGAKSIAYLREVGSGLYVGQLLERLGIAEALRAKVTRPDSDIVCELVAKGEVELGIVVITQILTTPGVELVGPLPPEIQSDVTFTAGVSSNSAEPEAARALIRFLTGPIAMPVITAQGMEPAGSAPR